MARFQEADKTNSAFGFAAVNFSLTNDKIAYTIKTSHQQLFLAPGFISSDDQGNTTTLGRGALTIPPPYLQQRLTLPAWKYGPM